MEFIEGIEVIIAKIVTVSLNQPKDYEPKTYEADLLVYQQALVWYPCGFKQVPGVVVRLDSGEIKIQELQLDGYEIRIYEITSPRAKFIYPKQLIHSFLEVVIGFGIGALVMLAIL